ncbi:MAG: ABC transporter permease [Dehalococcoidia bacterium]|nr:ABC transporter permease [Dehalococcoidia bacterium]
MITGSILASFAFGIAISAIPVFIGLGLGVQIHNPPVLVAGVLLASFCFACLGNMFSIMPTNLPATVNMISAVVKFPLVSISGVFIPLVDLPAWAQVVAYFSPLTYLTDAARYCIEGISRFHPVLDLLVLACLAALFLAISVMSHRRTMPRRV